MKQILYKIHDLTVRLNWSRCRIPWMFHKLDYFRTDEETAGAADLSIEVGPFDVDTSGWLNVDHKFFGRPGELVFKSHWKGFPWKTHWQGLEEGPITARLQICPCGVMAFPWLLQAEWILFWFVYKPLSELIWARRNRFVIHASGAALDGNAAIFTGYGSGLKTSYAMHLVRRGWEFLGDDQLLLTDEGILALPVSLQTFDFRVHEIDTEYITPLRLLRLGLHQLQGKTPRVLITDQAKIAALNVVIRSNSSEPNYTEISKQEAVGHTFHNCYNETIAHLHSTPGTSVPLTAYKIMFPKFDVDSMWTKLRISLEKHLSGIPRRRIEMTERWDDKFMAMAELGQGV